MIIAAALDQGLIRLLPRSSEEYDKASFKHRRFPSSSFGVITAQAAYSSPFAAAWCRLQ